MFADDSSIWKYVKEPLSAIDDLNDDLRKIQNYSDKWFMTLNPEKSEVLTISAKKEKLVYGNLQLNNINLKEVSTHRHLGLTLSSDMSWTSHVDIICKSAGSRLNLLRKLSFKLNRKALEILYFAYVRPILEYASPIFCQQTISNDMRMENLHNQAARICSGALFHTDRLRVLSDLGWSSLSDRRKTTTMAITYKLANNLCPKYLTELFGNLGQTTYSLRNTNNIRIPFCRTERYRRSFIPRASTVWNEIPVSNKTIPTYKQFNNKIKLNAAKPKPPQWFQDGNRYPNVLLTRL